MAKVLKYTLLRFACFAVASYGVVLVSTVIHIGAVVMNCIAIMAFIICTLKERERE